MTRTSHGARVALGVATAAALLTGCAKKMAGDPADPEEKPSEGGQKTAGATLFEKHCAKCHGVAGKGTDRAPAVVGEGALTRFTTAQDIFDFVSKEMPDDAPGSLTEPEYWAIVAFDLRANGLDIDEPLGPDNAASIRVHADEGKVEETKPEG